AIDETRVVAVRYETDLLRLFLLRNTNQMVLPCSVAGFGFRHLAEWKQRARQLRLRQFPKKVRLILLLVLAAEQTVTIRRRIKIDARVVSGRDFFAAQTRRESIKGGEFQT